MRLILFLLAIILFLLAAALDFGWITMTTPHPFGFVALGLACWAVAVTPWPAYDRR